MSKAIKIENLSKQYRLGLVSTQTLSHDLNRWWQRTVLRKEDPYLKIGEKNDRTTKGNSEYVWALKDINLEVSEGEVLGIIGKNGAGKSTLLKILSKVTSPTAGIVKVRGRIASLLEVGTGFHQEMTGRENIFMNGAILGMTKREIRSKLDEIVDFAGIERYLDTPVKRYSSGMTVRLGFAVAAHLEPDILIVDEVLAVGDAEFQGRAIGKIKDVSGSQGRTVLFVSHNLGVLKSLCKTGVVLVNGEMSGTKKNIQYAIDEYLKLNLINENFEVGERSDRAGSGEIKITKIRLNNSECEIDSDIPIQLIINYDALYQSFRGIFLISINTLDNQCVFFLDSSLAENNPVIFKKQGEIKVQLSGEISLAPNKYFINIAAYVNGVLGDYVKQAQLFSVRQGTFFINGKMPMGKSMLLVKQNWTFDYDGSR